MNPNPRFGIAVLTFSAAALVGLVVKENYTDKALIPTVGDRPTVGFGSTFRDDGSPVRIGDTITPPKALARTLNHIGKDEAVIKRCVKVPVNQIEYNLLTDFSYQFGSDTLCKSSIVSRLNVGDYAGSCEAYLKYRFSAGYDCSTPGNKRCLGVWTRQLERRNKCMEAQ